MPNFPYVLTHEERSIIEPAAARLQAAQAETQRAQQDVANMLALLAGRRDVTLSVESWTLDLAAPPEP